LEITKDNDAFIVVYSISDKSSFSIAIDLIRSIRHSENQNQPVILVGNKSDLVRKRAISREGIQF
jgi:GTPase SAR1 family protein